MHIRNINFNNENEQALTPKQCYLKALPHKLIILLASAVILYAGYLSASELCFSRRVSTAKILLLGALILAAAIIILDRFRRINEIYASMHERMNVSEPDLQGQEAASVNQGNLVLTATDQNGYRQSLKIPLEEIRNVYTSSGMIAFDFGPLIPGEEIHFETYDRYQPSVEWLLRGYLPAERFIDNIRER